jgi:predicted acylesterase/phospholipase RssA
VTRRFTSVYLLLACLLLTGGCASIQRNPVPEDAHLDVTVLGRDDLRFWGDLNGQPHDPSTIMSRATELQSEFAGIMHTEHNYLAISGGGAEGAYGAGLLVGWSDLGTRPEFTMVTGISTGALTAPFAFLGEEYDDEMKLLYTTLDSSRIFLRYGFFSILRGDAAADNTPLLDILEEHIDEDMIAAIAREHRKGRRLLIGTTNLDTSRPVIWNIGRIADSGHPGSARLIQQILLASAAIPGVFPPSYIQVETADGENYDEMHVDGGTSSQMFLYPSRTDWRKVMELLDVRGTATAWVIRNSRLRTEYNPVRPRVAAIARRSVSSLIRTQGIGDAFRIAAVTQRDGVDLKMTWIPPNAPPNPGRELFDPKYMTELFDYGYRRMLDGEAWRLIDLQDLTAPQ